MKQKSEIKKFEDVCELVGGSQPSKDNFIYEPKEGYIRLIQVRDYKTDKFITYIPKDLARKFCNADDIMIGRYGPPIFGIFKGLEGAYNVALMKAIVNEEICNKNYFYWFLKTDSLLKFVEHSSKRAAGQDGVRKELLDKYPILIPSFEEQKRIVSILDTAFELIDKAKANAEQNLKSSKELFESYLQNIFSSKGEGWEEKEFGDVISVLTDYHANGSYEILKENVDLKEVEDYAWMVRSTDFENNFENNFRYIDEKSYNFLNKSKVFSNDLIMSKIGNAGNVYIMPEIDRPCSLAMNLFLIRLDENVILPNYMYVYLKSSSGEFQIKSRLKGATTKTITKENVRSIKIPFPTLLIQKEIINKIDSITLEIKKLEAIYHQKLIDLEELKKSLLEKAFKGELKTEKLQIT